MAIVKTFFDLLFHGLIVAKGHEKPIWRDSVDLVLSREKDEKEGGVGRDGYGYFA